MTHNIVLSLADWIYVITIIAILICLTNRKDAMLPAVSGLMVIGTVLTGSLVGGVMVAFNAISAATIDLLPIIMTIAFVAMMNKVMEETGAYRVLVAPLRQFLHNPFVAYWVIAIATLLLSWCIRATPTVVLVGALLVPVAVVAGMPPIVAGMILSIYGKGIALSSDFVTQGTATITAKSVNLPVGDIYSAIIPVWAVTSVVAAIFTTWVAYKVIRVGRGEVQHTAEMLKKANDASGEVKSTLTGKIMAVLMPTAYIFDIYVILTNKAFAGPKAIALIAGTTLLLTIVAAVLQHRDKAFDKLVEPTRQGWAFAFTVFGPVVVIAGLFWLGGDHIKSIVGNPKLQGLTYDWGYWIADHVPLNVFVVALISMTASALAAFDGSGFAAIPLGATLAVSLGTAIGANVTYLVAGAVMAAIWTGATLVPWGFLAVSAAMVGVDPQELSRRNLIPCIAGLIAGLLIVTYLA